MTPCLKPIVLAISLFPVAGCATNTTGTDAAKIAGAIGHINPSKRDTCETQRQVAAQSSRIDTIKTGKEIVYKSAPCADASKNTEPKTS